MLFEVKANTSFWSPSQHEPLIILVCLPYLRFYPWELRNTPPILEVVRLLREVSEGSETAYRDILWKFFLFTRRLYPMPKGLVRKVLYSRPYDSVSS